MNDDSVESSRYCCSSMIGLMGISKCRLGHDQLRGTHLLATSSFYSATRRGPKTMDRLALLIRVRGKMGVGLGHITLGAHWGQSNILPLDLNLKH
jgi:hypothetical protein